MDLPVTCIDPRHAKAALKMQINKSDRNDAVGMARIFRCEWCRRFALYIYGYLNRAQSSRRLKRAECRVDVATGRLAPLLKTSLISQGQRWRLKPILGTGPIMKLQRVAAPGLA
jgi:hypothetical protein